MFDTCTDEACFEIRCRSHRGDQSTCRDLRDHPFRLRRGVSNVHNRDSILQLLDTACGSSAKYNFVFMPLARGVVGERERRMEEEGLGESLEA